MEADHKYLIDQAKTQEENRKKAMQDMEQHGNKYIDAKTGEIVDKVYSITLKLSGNKEQMQCLSSFLRDWGIKYEKVSE